MDKPDIISQIGSRDFEFKYRYLSILHWHCLEKRNLKDDLQWCRSYHSATTPILGIDLMVHFMPFTLSGTEMFIRYLTSARLLQLHSSLTFFFSLDLDVIYDVRGTHTSSQITILREFSLHLYCVYLTRLRLCPFPQTKPSSSITMSTSLLFRGKWHLCIKELFSIIHGTIVTDPLLLRRTNNNSLLI